MKKFGFLIFTMGVLLSHVPVFGQQSEHFVRQQQPWCSIKPLATNSDDLKDLFGPPMRSDESVSIYDTDQFRITIWFPNQSKNNKCNWNVSRTTVVKALIVPKSAVKLSSLNIDFSVFEKKEGSDDGFWDYTEKKLGFRVNVAESSNGIEYVEFIDISPRQADIKRACKNQVQEN